MPVQVPYGDRDGLGRTPQRADSRSSMLKVRRDVLQRVEFVAYCTSRVSFGVEIG